VLGFVGAVLEFQVFGEFFVGEDPRKKYDIARAVDYDPYGRESQWMH